MTDVDDDLDLAAPQVPIVDVDDDLALFVEGDFMNYLTAGVDRVTAWCPQWRDHPDAVQRLAAIHAQWVAQASVGTLGLHEFYRDVLDHHLPILTALDGPFRSCLFGGGHTPHKRIDKATQR